MSVKVFYIKAQDRVNVKVASRFNIGLPIPPPPQRATRTDGWMTAGRMTHMFTLKEKYGTSAVFRLFQTNLYILKNVVFCTLRFYDHIHYESALFDLFSMFDEKQKSYDQEKMQEVSPVVCTSFFCFIWWSVFRVPESECDERTPVKQGRAEGSASLLQLISKWKKVILDISRSF